MHPSCFYKLVDDVDLSADRRTVQIYNARDWALRSRWSVWRSYRSVYGEIAGWNGRMGRTTRCFVNPGKNYIGFER